MFSTTNVDHLTRSNIWSTQLKEVLRDELQGQKYVDWLTEFPDGDTFNIPSIGTPTVLDYAEGQAIRYTAADTGNFTFSITDYKASATYVTNKAKQDMFYMDRLISTFVPGQNRAIMEAIEADVMDLGPEAQTSSDLNLINGAPHRWVTAGTNQVMQLSDFAKANFSLNKANVPFQNRVAIVDPSVGFALETATNLTNVSNNPMWEGIITTGLVNNMAFIKNVYGFDVYVSNRLKTGVNETINSITSGAGVANLFFSAAPGVLPFIGAMRQPPKVDSEYNKDFQRDEYVTTCRYGLKLYRPENMVVVITDTDQVA